jgi:predicted  nucleic acid-binding Zn-ribbon protein
VLLQSLKEQLEVKDNVLKTNSETQKHLQGTIDVLVKAEKAKNRTIQQLREKEKKHQATIDDLTKRVKALEQLVRGVDGETKDVSICKIEKFTTSDGLIAFRIPIQPTWFNLLAPEFGI